MKIYLDDTRPIPHGWVGARTSKEFKTLVRKAVDEEGINALAFDYELGFGQPKGIHLLLWVAREFPDVLLNRSTSITFHSSSPGANEEMSEFLDEFRQKGTL